MIGCYQYSSDAVLVQLLYFNYRRPDVHSFGIWRNSSLKVFVQKTTDKNCLIVELKKLNKMFFTKYNLDIVKSKLVEKMTMRQGNSIMPDPPNENGTAGTLGGFVTKTDNEKKIYALTCNHIFPIENQLAYTETYKSTEVGTCVFTTRERSCDLAVIEIIESFVDKCDVAFRKSVDKTSNAKLYAEHLGGVGVVHKIGAKTKMTTGTILSSEYYNKLKDESNREYIFLVKGMGEYFSEEGDSGSLVFSRPQNLQQNYVNVVGMVYASNPDVVEEDIEDEKAENTSHDLEGSQRSATAIANINMPTSKDEKEYAATANEHDTKDISFCYRIHSGLELFEEHQGKDFSVKFKDDLSLSTSESSESDDSDEETT